LRRAALVHDLGRVAVPARVWAKPGPLTRGEREQVRLHAYHSERVLDVAPALRPLARLAGSHGERCDGSGYHRGSGAGDLPLAARLLAAADCYQAMREPRPYRPALSAGDAADGCNRPWPVQAAVEGGPMASLTPSATRTEPVIAPSTRRAAERRSRSPALATAIA
jgi:HD-GYP domain-containing protein (c-di-GMP phosphodiesterase class II)